MKNDVAILMATYNGEKYLKEQIDSIINQTYKKWVLYISDDGSKDNTNKIIDEYTKKYKDKIIRISDQKHLGAKGNFANLFHNVDGYKYYLFCDQDDVWKKEKVEVMVKFANKKDNKIPFIVYSDTTVVDENLNVINESLIKTNKSFLTKETGLRHLLIEDYFPGHATLFNNTLKEKVGTISDKAEMHDWWITLVAGITGEIYFIDKSLVLYRQHGSNVVGAHMFNQNNTKSYLNKLKNFKKTLSTWHTYQKLIKDQTEELINLYGDEDNIKDAELLLKIMNKNRLIRLFLLLKNDFIHRKKIRIFRLVI